MIDRYIDWLMLVPSGDALPIANERWTNAGAQFGPSAGTFPQSRARAPSGHLQRHGHSQLFITWPIRQDVRPRCYHVNVFFSYYSSFFSLLIILSWFLFFFLFFFFLKRYGQMTAGSFVYIGPQGIVHGTTVILT